MQNRYVLQSIRLRLFCGIEGTFIPVLKMQIVFTSMHSNCRMRVHLGLIHTESKVG